MARPTRLRSDSGATAVEFAVAFPVLLVVVCMALYGGLYLYYAAVAEHVARDAARDASIPVAGTATYPSDSGVSREATHAGDTLIPNPTSVSVTSTPGDPPREGDEVTVAVTYDLPAVAEAAKLLWFIPSPPTSITRTASARRE